MRLDEILKTSNRAFEYAELISQACLPCGLVRFIAASEDIRPHRLARPVTIQPPDALFNSVWREWKVVMNDRLRASLKVQAFLIRPITDQHLASRVLQERRKRIFPVLARRARD